MSKLVDIETIKNEVSNLHCYGDIGYANAIADILELLNTLPEESPWNLTKM